MTQGAEAFKPETGSEKRAAVLSFRKVNPMWSKHAKFMAETAGIVLSQDTINKYSMLRDEKLVPHIGMSDQQLLAKALRMSGDETSLIAFTEKHPHIFKN